MIWPFDPLRPLSYLVVEADPPWPFDLRSAAGGAKSAAAHYDPMSVDDIVALPVGHLAQTGGLMILWITSGRLREGLACFDAWDVRLVRTLTWRKVTKNGKPRMGTGYRVRDFSEEVLFGVFGTRDARQWHQPLRSCFDGVAREHSRKPEEFYEMVEAATPGAYRCSLFSGGAEREGWDGWGRAREHKPIRVTA